MYYINVLDYEYNRTVKTFFFFDLMYQHNLISTINKPARVGKKISKTAILKTNLTDHFPIVIALENDGLSH